MRRVFGLGLVVFVLAVATSAEAGMRTRWHDLAESPVYKEKMGGMIGRGLLNVVTSPIDVVTGTVDGTKQGPPFVGTLRGLATGVACGVLRLGSGAVDLVTFWAPGFNGFGMSEEYGTCLGTGDSMASDSSYDSSSYSFEPLPEPATENIAFTSEPIEAAPAPKTWKK